MRRRRSLSSEDERPAWLLREGGGAWSDADRVRFHRMENAFRDLLAASIVLFVVAVVVDGTAGVAAVVLAVLAAGASGRVRSALPYFVGPFDTADEAADPRPPGKGGVAFDGVLGTFWIAVGVAKFAKDGDPVGIIGALAGVAWLASAARAVHRLERSRT